MTAHIKWSCIFAIMCASVMHANTATGFSKASVVQVPYGVTKITLTNDGVSGVIVRGRRDNFNAHGFDIVTIYAEPSLQPQSESDSTFLLVPLFKGEEQSLYVVVNGGADCLLQDFRLVRHAGQNAELILAERVLGQSFADAATVTFRHYRLKHNAERLVGRPVYYFEMTSAEKAKKEYCDVGDAFQQELGLGPYRNPSNY